MSITFTRQTQLLFIGDSITDCGWRQCPEEIGNGYVRLIRDYLCAEDPANAPVLINRGLSGNQIPDLQKRCQRDVLELSPDVPSIFIGINDVCHALIDPQSACPLDAYIAG